MRPKERTTRIVPDSGDPEPRDTARDLTDKGHGQILGGLERPDGWPTKGPGSSLARPGAGGRHRASPFSPEAGTPGRP